MPNLSDLKIESRILITLDSCLLKMAGKLNTSFDPDVPESVKLLKEFRATMATRRQWAKEYTLEDLLETSLLKPEVIAKAQSIPDIENDFRKKAIDAVLAKLPGKNVPLHPQDFTSGLLAKR